MASLSAVWLYNDRGLRGGISADSFVNGKPRFNQFFSRRANNKCAVAAEYLFASKSSEESKLANLVANIEALSEFSKEMPTPERWIQ
ncbi:hypothetical protein OIU84_024707 [Salix udensis]|uniref:Uncharacterized protein n=1 Tax=Salix udensis TaxID=889485 RepID=A0AAD6KID4_9ROSI|nr:hypothetical protein OIU84_024707 [Salix udensis]